MQNLTVLSNSEFVNSEVPKSVNGNFEKLLENGHDVNVFELKPISQKPVRPSSVVKNNVKLTDTEKVTNGCGPSEMKETKEKSKRDRKVLHPQAKELILNVVNFMKQEANGTFVVSARKVQCRAALATGFSERTVRRVVKESKTLPVTENANGEGTSVSFPPKKVPNRPKPKTGLDILTQCAVRKIIHRIYVSEKTVPTIKKIHQKLVEEIGFKGGSRSAHKIIKELGFYWKKTKAKTFVLLEKNEIRLKRIEYLREIARLKHDRRTIVYVGNAIVGCGTEVVTALLAGNENGYIPSSLFIMENPKDLTPHLTAWAQEALCPALPPNTVVVLDGCTLSTTEDRIPSLDSDAQTMKKWLTSRGISFKPDMLRPELHQVIRKNAGKIRKNKGAVEQVLLLAGHTVLKIPTDHPDLNPVVWILNDVKRIIAERRSEGGNDGQMVVQTLEELGAHSWSTRHSEVRLIEQQYLASEGIVDAEVERVLAANKDTSMSRDDEIDDPQDNINFVRHFMGGLLGLSDNKVYSS